MQSRKVGVELGWRAVVVSPHLDDAVLSLGAAIAASARRGTDVVVLTVLAGDPCSTSPAGRWDRASGFQTAGEAAQVRRMEDRRACEILGATPIWLPFGDEQYGVGASETVVARAVSRALDGAATVLIPGFPLLNPDHAWVAATLPPGVPSAARLGLYVEQPYTAYRSAPPPPADIEFSVQIARPWVPVSVGRRDRRLKRKAVRAYGSQLELLGRNALREIERYDANAGGELIAWVSPPGQRQDGG